MKNKESGTKITTSNAKYKSPSTPLTSALPVASNRVESFRLIRRVPTDSTSCIYINVAVH